MMKPHPYSIASANFVRCLANFLRYHAGYSPAECAAASSAYASATGRPS